MKLYFEDVLIQTVDIDTPSLQENGYYPYVELKDINDELFSKFMK